MDQVKITGDLISKPYVAGAGCNRKSCAKCGGAVVDDKSATMGMIMVPAGLWKGKQFEPTMHIMYGMKICSMKDGLPKFKTLPKGMGGDDELVEE